jgi:molybdenum cofactor cytidylyltransferase
MKFGPVAIADSLGAVVAHMVKREGLVLKKGHVVTAGDIAKLKAAGVAEIVAARFEPGDVPEDEAARRLAQALAGDHLRVEAPFTGRSNLFAEVDGVFVASADAIDAINALDESVTLATLPPMRRVVAGEMVATVKIIPFAAPGAALARALDAAAVARLAVAPFLPLRVGVVSTLLPGLKNNVVNKTLRVLDERLAVAGARVVQEERVAHETGALAGAIARVASQSDLVIVFGASAITDRRDVIPAAVEAAEGVIEHFGMPVDPGNLLLIGTLPDAKPILGAPGCARSPAENGFDWVLQRLLAGLSVTRADIRRMGAGGLLMEIVSRPQLRAPGHDEQGHG